MKTYELTYIVSPEIPLEEAGAKGKEIESIIQGKEGSVLRQSNPSAKTLSYPIGKMASGFLGVLEFQLEPEKLLELKEVIAKDGKILRHMVIIKEAAEFKKEKRRSQGLSQMPKTKLSPVPEIKHKTTGGTKDEKQKVELKDIEQKLDEILGE